MNRIALLLPLFVLGCAGRSSAQDGPEEAWRVVVAAPGEPGEPLEVAGAVYAADGATPVPGARVYVYQTDARGYYAADDAMDNEHPRLHGTMTADAAGRYAYRTIRPGPYPGGGVPAHVHFVVSAPGFRARRFEIVFDDDPLVTPRIRQDATRADSPFALCTPARADDGVWRCTQDVRLSRR